MNNTKRISANFYSPKTAQFFEVVLLLAQSMNLDVFAIHLN